MIYINGIFRTTLDNIQGEAEETMRNKLMPIVESKICSMIEKVER